MSKDTSFCLRTDRELMGWRFTFQGRSTIKKFRFRVQRQLFRKSKKAGPSVDAISLLLRRSFAFLTFQKYINDNTKSSLFSFLVIIQTSPPQQTTCLWLLLHSTVSTNERRIILGRQRGMIVMSSTTTERQPLQTTTTTTTTNNNN